jgi:hypothetical protein
MNYKNYSDYFESLADLHEDITHTIGTEGQRGFYSADVEQLVAGFRTDIFEKGTVMVLMNYAFSHPERTDSTPSKEIRGGFCILKHVTLDDFPEEVIARGECETIAEQVVKRINMDSEEQNGLFEDIATIITNVNTTHYTSAPNWKGTFTTFEFKVNANLCVDPAKWKDL